MPNTRPNILLITTDQQRGDCLGLEPDGPDCLQTPNLDWIGRTGTHFRRGYAECPSCIPATTRADDWDGTRCEWCCRVIEGRSGIRHTPLAGELSDSRLSNRNDRQTPSECLMRKRYGFDHMQLADATRGRQQRLRRMVTAVPWSERR